MNKVILSGRLVGDCNFSKNKDGKITAARNRIAVDRRFKKEEDPSADFITIVFFGKQAEVAEQYLCQGIKVIVSGRLQTGSYTNKEGKTVYTSEVIVEDLEFAESKSVNEKLKAKAGKEMKGIEKDAEGFMNIPEDDEKVPFT